MLFAVFSDVHANLLALEAVLKDINRHKPERIYCAGDLVGYCTFPNQVIDLVRSSNIEAVMGNYDDAIGNERMVCGCDYKDQKSMLSGLKSIEWTRTNTYDFNKAFLRQLPREIKFSAGRHRVLMVHGSPLALNEYLFQDASEEYLNDLLTTSNCDILICGHTHIPYHRTVTAGHVINAGSAGKPKHGDPNACYALVEADHNLKVTFVKVPYDYQRVAQEITAAGLPEEFSMNILTGKA